MRHDYGRVVENAIDASSAVRNTLSVLQVIELREKVLMERLAALTHAYAGMCRAAAKGVTLEVAGAVLSGKASSPSVSASEANHGDRQHQPCSSTNTIEEKEEEKKREEERITEMRISPPVLEAFAPLLHAAAASAAGAGMLAAPSVASSRGVVGSGTAQMVLSVATELGSLREAIRAVEDELEGLSSARNELVAALAIV